MLTMRLYNPQQGHEALRKVWEWCKPMLTAGHRLEIECMPEKRSSKENRMLHALITDIARQVEWAGKKQSVETWKRLLVAAWSREQGISVEILPALDGHGVDIVPVRTSRLTRSECADLITYVQAWAATQGIDAVDLDTGEIKREPN